jgi:hypothetical protein
MSVKGPSVFLGEKTTQGCFAGDPVSMNPGEEKFFPLCAGTADLTLTANATNPNASEGKSSQVFTQPLVLRMKVLIKDREHTSVAPEIGQLQLISNLKVIRSYEDRAAGQLIQVRIEDVTSPGEKQFGMFSGYPDFAYGSGGLPMFPREPPQTGQMFETDLLAGQYSFKVCQSFHKVPRDLVEKCAIVPITIRRGQTTSMDLDKRLP